MKRDYLKPEIKTLKLRMNTFLTTGSLKDPNYGIGEEGGSGGSNIGDAGEGDQSRSLRRGMWDDMD